MNGYNLTTLRPALYFKTLKAVDHFFFAIRRLGYYLHSTKKRSIA
jgi:hypothetical protein